jgi:hypothetical protein
VNEVRSEAGGGQEGKVMKAKWMIRRKYSAIHDWTRAMYSRIGPGTGEPLIDQSELEWCWSITGVVQGLI